MPLEPSAATKGIARPSGLYRERAGNLALAARKITHLRRVLESSVRPRLAGVAQLVEQLIRNQQVVGSSPTAGSKILSVNSPD